MKEIQKEVVIKRYDTMFVANDGTEFTTKEECKKYEETAKCILLAKYRPLVIKSSDEFSLFGFGSEDNVIEVVKMNSQSDMDLVLQNLLLENPHCYCESKNDTPDDVARKKANLNKLTARLNKALQERDLIFIHRGYDYDGFYFEGTRNEHIDVLRNIDKVEDKPETGE